jgi:hypothetical protein
MDELEKLLKDIELLRADMESEIEKGNLLDYETLIISQKLDHALNTYRRITTGATHRTIKQVK